MEPSQADIQLFIDAVSKQSDYDFSDYSLKSFSRRIEKLMGDHRASVPELIHKMGKDKSFLERLVREITVNTTELFRDPQIWQSIRNMIVPRYQYEDFINIWHAGSSTGQEVYSMLILMHQQNLFEKSHSFATDLNTEVIETARSGLYRYREIDEYIDNYNAATVGLTLPPIDDYLEISRKRSTIKVKPYLVEKPKYKKHDLVSLENPWEHRFHIIFCRNVLIYFNHELQNRIFEMFYDSLYTGGALIIGKHEGILGDISLKFDKYGTIYVKK